MAAEVKSIFEGTWSVDRSENFEAYLDAADVGFMKKKMAMNVTPKLTIKVNGDTIETCISAGPKTQKTSFKLGEEYDADGESPAKAIATFSDGKLIIELTPKDKSKKPQTITREIVNGELVQTMAIKDSCTAKRIFKKVSS